MNLLIIDDEIEIINGIMAGVRWENLCFQTVYQATSIEESKKLFYQDTIDIVLCDIEMPDGSGLDLLEWIRMQYPKTVRIIMTVSYTHLTGHQDPGRSKDSGSRRCASRYYCTGEPE